LRTELEMFASNCYLVPVREWAQVNQTRYRSVEIGFEVWNS